MSDPYQILIPRDNDAILSGWSLPDDIRKEMDRRLREQLATDPIHYLVRAIAPWGEPLNLFAFSLPEKDHPSVSHLFQFHVLYGEDEKSLLIADLGHQRWDGDPPETELDPPAPKPN